jgi:hypothetical protein
MMVSTENGHAGLNSTQGTMVTNLPAYGHTGVKKGQRKINHAAALGQKNMEAKHFISSQ